MSEPEPNPSRDEKARDKEGWVKGLGLFGVITSELLGASAAGIGTGYLLWKKVGLPWWILLVCGGAGLGIAFYRLYLISKKDF